ncbi:MAG TPA: DNA methyltransferase [Gemmatimonadaceae bacterium]
MRPLSAYAELLARCDSLEHLARLAATLGCDSDPLPLDADALTALGLAPPRVAEARIVPGRGAIRALLARVSERAPLRESIAAIAARLGAAAPQALWLLLAVRPAAREVAIATWAADRARPRVAALVVDRDRVMPSDAETVAALAGAARESDLLVHALWLEALGREGLTRRFYRALERVVGTLAREARGHASDAERAELALLHVSRLLFLSFLETKGWLDGERRFLELGFAHRMERGGDYHGRFLLPLFFGTLNTPVAHRAKAARALGRIPFLNGGLFARTPLERRRSELRFTDEAMGLVFSELLSRYRFTAREEGTTWSEAAIDPEMLGRAFESLMDARARRVSGAFFTPQPLVAHVTHAALATALAGGPVSPAAAADALHGESIDPPVARALRERIVALRILDPSCGSGTFLVHALEELAALLGRCGDGRTVTATRRALLTACIFGVDVNPRAVWLCELRLWLSVVIESDERDPLAVLPLPNLDRNIRVGDTLAGDAFGEGACLGGAAVMRLRGRYAAATGSRKRALERALERAERARAIALTERAIERCSARRRELLATLRGRDLFGERLRPTRAERDHLAGERARSRELHAALRALRDGGALPFAWSTHFPDVASRGGFGVVVGNPPWVRLHHIPARARAALRSRFAVFRGAGWSRGASAARAGSGFAAQVDLAALFTERALALLHEGGALALILPAKLWRSLAGGGLRRHLRERARLVALEDWSEAPAAFDAAVYPSLLVAHRAAGDEGAASRPSALAMSVRRARDAIAWTCDPDRLALDADPASPWLPLPSPARAAFDRVARAGIALADGHLGAPLLGVKCGCNDAFVLRVEGGDDVLARVRSGNRAGAVERAMLRPLLRGERVLPWRAGGDPEWLLWTHDSGGAPLDSLPPYASRWLAHWRPRLRSRADARAARRWWAIFRTASAAPTHPRVVWADVGRMPRALVLQAGDRAVALNSCYVLPCADAADAHAVAALLNSPLAAAWLGALAEPARGGYRRFLAWTVAMLPIPRDWTRARAALAPLGERGCRGDDPSGDELLDAALHAYHLRRRDVNPLIAWCAR